MFYISLSGFVGISTNALAIKMLFRPKAPTFFGRHGLIPKNKFKIARKIAEETEKRLLNIETIMDNIEKGRVIEDTISSVTKAVEQYLSQEVNRKKIADTILSFYNEYADRFFSWLGISAETYLSDFANRHITVDSVWGAIKPKIKDFFESDELKHKTSTWIIVNLIEKIPELSSSISEILDQYIEEQVWWKKTVLKGVKQISGLEKDKIANLIRDIFFSRETYSQVVMFVEDNLKNVEAYLEQDEIREKTEEIHVWIKEYITEVAREKALPALRQKIDFFLGSDESWNTVDRYLIAVLNTLPGRLKAYLHMPANVEAIRRFIPGIIRKLNIREIVADNINNQDTEEFEKMIMKISGENFAAIEVLGGVLGMLAGVALKEPLFLIVLPVGIIVFLFVEHILMVIKRKY